METTLVRSSPKVIVFGHSPVPPRHRPRFSLLYSRRFDTSIVSSSSSVQLHYQNCIPDKIESTEEMSIEFDDHKNRGQLRKRVMFGIAIGVGTCGIVVAGGWVFTAAVSAAVFAAAREYFRLVRCQGVASDVSVTSSAFLVAMALICQRTIPRFSQLSSTMFGLFYCAYLPCFWIKLRCGLASPSLHTEIGKYWPILLGGRAHWTVGLVATIISVCSIIAADTFAFLAGRAFGRTPLTSISPKKTLEGAFAGLVGCVVITITLSKILQWPSSLLSATAFGILNFASSLFGDLTESLIKRDAGVKESGSLIPGHGGILDRVDSYLFTGALCYSFVKFALPAFGA